MNKQIFAIASVLAGAAAFAVPAFAQAAANPQSSTVSNAQPVTTAQPAANAQPATLKRQVPPLNSRTCIRDTGSHIKRPDGQCLPVAGTSYSQQDLQRTGAASVGQALQMLDPSITVHGH